MQNSQINWLSLSGSWDFSADGSILFKGREEEVQTGDQPNHHNELKKTMMPLLGQAISNQAFSEGDIFVDVEFTSEDPSQVAEVVVQFEPATRNALHAGFSVRTGNLYSMRIWGPDQEKQRAEGPSVENKIWTNIATVGEPTELKSNKKYQVLIRCRGTRMDLIIDGVMALSHEMGVPMPGRQVGLFAISKHEIKFSNFRVVAKKPQAFIVMQFNTKEYEDLYREVIDPVCDKHGLKAYRASDTFAPGIVISDIAREIERSRVVIAEITPPNPNVYYEVGYADALKKQIILIADRNIEKIPFDIRPYRIIFYENSIGGKQRVEAELGQYLERIMSTT